MQFPATDIGIVRRMDLKTIQNFSSDNAIPHKYTSAKFVKTRLSLSSISLLEEDDQ